MEASRDGVLARNEVVDVSLFNWPGAAAGDEHVRAGSPVVYNRFNLSFAAADEL
ncbi:hypothetical protein [Dactylosporangium sp. CA-233914]|uniref:hypothetical protein n=1 Tax=Dactylosporangium sp. CA-233914 TaxID=3239934 RepID=UPI003D8E5448